MNTFILLMMVIAAEAQSPVADFTIANVETGAPVSLSDYASNPGVVLFFTSNACPFDAHYRARIGALVKEYEGKIQFLLINSYPEPAEGAAAMKSAYAGWKIAAPYLADKEQTALRAIGARRSPEVFLLKSSKSGMTLFYSGAIDDSPQVATAVRQSILKEAIEQLLAGGAPVATTRAAGCTIRSQ